MPKTRGASLKESSSTSSSAGTAGKRIGSPAPKRMRTATTTTNTASALSEQGKFLEDVREQAKKGLSSSRRHKMKNRDLDYMMKSVRGLIDTNGEIWSACKEHTCFVPGKFTPGSCVKMKRICFKEASVLKKSNQLTISSQKTLYVHDFGTPPLIPPCLSSLFLLDPQSEGEVFPCYNAYLRKAGLLNDGVLVSFLTQLQEHLEDVQIFVGRIETWLSEPASTTQFLNELFGSGVALIEDVDASMCKPGGKVSNGATCIHCGKPPTSHIIQNWSDEYRCQGINKIGLFYVPAPTTLLTSNTALVRGQMDVTFDLCTDDGKEKLKTFVAFLKLYG